MGDNSKFSMYDALFGSDGDVSTQTAENAGLTVSDVSVKNLHEFQNHPFLVEQNEDFESLTESVKLYGIMEPLLVRPGRNGIGYEIISGHRRTAAAKAAGLKEVPAIVLDVDDDTATIMMVDANKKREKFLPSELAHAFKMRLDACKHQGVAIEGDDGSTAAIGKDFGASERNVRNYLRLNDLSTDLLDLVDTKKLQLGAAVELSFLSPDNQQMVLDAYYETGKLPKKAQASMFRELGSSLDETAIRNALTATEKPTDDKLVIKGINNYFPPNYSREDKEKLITELLVKWYEDQARSKKMAR